MFKNIVKLAFRNLAKNKLFSFISILGLSLAIGCFTVSFVYVDYTTNMDSFHKNVDEIFLVQTSFKMNGNTQVRGDTPMPLGPSLVRDFPQIKRCVRIRNSSATFRNKDKVFRENFLFVDEEFLDMFTFPLLAGGKEALKDRNAVFISEQYTEKYFGNENPIGKELIVSHGESYEQSFFVRGVVKEIPDNSSIQFNILLPYVKRVDWGVSDLNDWRVWTWATFIQVENPKDLEFIKSGMDKYIRLQNALEEDWSINAFDFGPLSTISENAYRVRNSIGRGGHPSAQIVLFLFGLLLLLIACLNYTNIGIATATRRLKEIGIRKVLGSTKQKLIHQFIGENLLLCLIAVIIGVLLANFYLFPTFIEMTGSQVKMKVLENYRLWLYFFLTLLITGIGAGGYPALYVSRFQPVNILRKTQKVGGGTTFTKIILSGQFVMAFIMIYTSIIISQTAVYQKNNDWGYDQEQVVGVRLDGRKHFEAYKNDISQNPNILSIAGSQSHVGRSWSRNIITYEGNKYEITIFKVGYDYLKTLQLRLKEGRTFDMNLATDMDRSVIINEKFAARMGWKEPLEKSVVINNTSYYVIGMVEDFHYRHFGFTIEPTLFCLCKQENFYYLSARIKAGAVTKTAEYLEKRWKTLFPDVPYNGFFQDEIWSRYFQTLDAATTIFSFIAVMAIVISCMGLFGLISISIMKRMKEISIRKIFGASVAHIMYLLNKKLVLVLIISTAIASPLCFFLFDPLFGSAFIYRPPITIFPFLTAGAFLTIISLSTVFSQVFKAARSNPVDTLRIE